MFFFLQKKASPYLRIFGYYFSLQITTILSALNFPFFKLKLIITSKIIAVDNFKDHIWNQHILLVNIPKNEDNQRGKKITTHPPTHTIKLFWVSKKGGYYRVKLKCPKSVPRTNYYNGPFRGLLPQPPFTG